MLKKRLDFFVSNTFYVNNVIDFYLRDHQNSLLRVFIYLYNDMLTIYIYIYMHVYYCTNAIISSFPGFTLHTHRSI